MRCASFRRGLDADTVPLSLSLSLFVFLSFLLSFSFCLFFFLMLMLSACLPRFFCLFLVFECLFVQNQSVWIKFSPVCLIIAQPWFYRATIKPPVHTFVPDIDDCVPNPCENGGTCMDGIDDFTCNCPVGWVGKNCSEGWYKFFARFFVFYAWNNHDFRCTPSRFCGVGSSPSSKSRDLPSTL